MEHTSQDRARGCWTWRSRSGSRVQRGLHPQRDPGPIGLKRVRLCVLKVDHYPRHGWLNTVQTDPNFFHTLCVDWDPPLPRVRDCAGQDQNQAVRVDGRLHAGSHPRAQGYFNRDFRSLLPHLQVFHCRSFARCVLGGRT